MGYETRANGATTTIALLFSKPPLAELTLISSIVYQKCEAMKFVASILVTM